MVRFADLDSLNSTDIVDSNYLIVGNTNSLYKTSKLSFGNALQYFITDQAISAETAQNLIDSAISDEQITVANTDTFITLSNPNFTLNQFTPQTLTLGHKTKEVTAASTTNTGNSIVKNISIDAAAHIVEITSENLDDNFIPRSEFNFQINGDNAISISSPNQFTDANRSITLTHKAKPGTLSDITQQTNYFVNSISFDDFGHVDSVSIAPMTSIDSSYLATIINSDWIMERHFLSEPTLTNITPSAGVYLSGMIFDDFGHAVEVSTADIEDFVTTNYIMNHHEAGETAEFITNNPLTSVSGGLVVSRLKFDSYGHGHVIDAAVTNLDDRYLSEVVVIGDDAISVDDSSVAYIHTKTTFALGAGGTGHNKTLVIKHKENLQRSTNVINTLSAGTYFDIHRYDSFGHTVSLTASASGNLDDRIEFIIDSAYIRARTDDLYMDSIEVRALVDSAYIQLRDRIRDSAFVTEIIDEAYIQARDRFRDSNFVTFIVDSGYINERVDPAVDSAEVINIITNTVDATYINNLVVIPDQGLDSAAVASIIDSAYINERVNIDSAVVSSIIDSALILFTLDSNVTVHSNLYVDSDIIAKGDITAFGTFSDERLKENLVKIDNALDKIDLMTGYTFNYIAQPDIRMTGVLAGDAKNALPELVYTTNTGYDAVRYGNALGLVIEAIKELKYEVEELKKKIN
jgi:hypothetical protein